MNKFDLTEYAPTKVTYFCGPSLTVSSSLPCIKTNADRIRAMSDEELANFLSPVDCPPHSDITTCHYTSCDDCWIDWLKKEVEK